MRILFGHWYGSPDNRRFWVAAEPTDDVRQHMPDGSIVALLAAQPSTTSGGFRRPVVGVATNDGAIWTRPNVTPIRRSDWTRSAYRLGELIDHGVAKPWETAPPKRLSTPTPKPAKERQHAEPN